MSYSKWVIAAAVVLIQTLSPKLEAEANESRVSKPGCPEKCGNVSIPYPFGIGNKCSYDLYFNITCNHTFRPPFPTPIYGTNLEVLNISLLGGQIRLASYVARRCFGSSGELLPNHTRPWIKLAKFTFSGTENILAATGCDTYAWFAGNRSLDRTYNTGCMTACKSPKDVNDGECSGAGCCETPIPKDVHYKRITVGSFSNYTDSTNYKEYNFTRCSSAFMVAKDSFSFTLANLTVSPDQMPSMLPAVFDWTVGNETCEAAQANETCLCCTGQGSRCVDFKQGGYRCSCLPGYSGNPYLPHGCQDINECSPGNVNDCKEPATCVNSEGSYSCQCPKGFQGNGTTLRPCLPIQKSNQTALNIILGVGGGIILLLVLGFLLHWHHGQKQIKKMRDTFFRQNGGLILHERLSGRDASVDLVKMFTVEDLNKATDNYSENNIIGRGGFGMVYKGTLPNNQVVAIKKSLKVDPSQIEQFINEVLVLSQVNNRNVVKLLGCCLETEVPLLVYEFIRNGTLHDHLHDERKATALSWDTRLRIATEVAEVLAYLHTTVSTPIIHRDIKSMNILLDENYIAKVSDFGASRLVPMGEEQVATMVLGTCGYLDPEYMQTGKLNEKSDVYSFGVVLVELLTRRKAHSFYRPENERYLAMYFLLKFKEQHVLEIFDEKIMTHVATEQLMEVANLARRCLELKGEDRPNMKEVAMELERITRQGVHSQLSKTNVGIFEEERQYLVSKTIDDSDAYYRRNILGKSDSQSSYSLQLVPSDPAAR